MEEKQRIYAVIDMKSFYASVECAERGLDALTAKLVVADSERSDKTICLAVSPAMKELGIRNRCRLYEIPESIDYIIARPRMRKYIEYAAEIYGIYLKYIDKEHIHVYSIDECIIDITDYLKLYNVRAKEFVSGLMKEILEKLGIPSSTGIGTNMYLAKIALDITAKHSPDRIGWLNEEKFIKTLWHHRPITDFWQISGGTARRLAKYGAYDMEGITRIPEETLYREFGVNAELIIDHAYGREPCLMEDIKKYVSKSKSISHSQILPCNYTFEEGRVVLEEMVQTGCYDMARQKLYTRNFNLFIGYGDRERSNAKGHVRMSCTTNLFSIIIGYAHDLYDRIVDRNLPIRRIGVDFSDLGGAEYEQYDLFTDVDKVEKEKKLIESVLTIQDKFGKNAILKGIDLHEKATQRERNNMVGGHRGGDEDE